MPKLTPEQAQRVKDQGPVPLVEIALDYATKGYAVFPLQPGRKDPMSGSHGFKDATRDQDQIKRWWASHPDANIGIATGTSGLMVVDLDIKHEADGLRSWHHRTARLDLPEPAVVHTPSGGVHLYYQVDPDAAPVSNSADGDSGIDVRGDGGYVVAPGSHTGEGFYYLDTSDSDPDMVTDLPSVGRLHVASRELIAATRPSKTNEGSERHDTTPSSLPLYPEGQRHALWLEYDRLANTTSGGRNDQLNKSVMSLAQIASAQDAAITQDDVRTMAERACHANGLIPDDGWEGFNATYASAWSAGSGQPRELGTVEEATRLAYERELQERVRQLRLSREAQRVLDQEGQTETGQAVDAGSFLFELPDTTGGVWGTGDHVLWAEGEALMIVGPPGVGKTTLTGQLVRARIGLGDGQVLGYPVKPTGSKVLYLAMDRPRQIARSLARHFTPSERETVTQRLAIHQGPPPADLALKPETLLWMAQEHGADTVIVDSLKDAAVGLSKDEVGAAYNRARQLLIANGIEVVELHHQKKSGNGEGSKPNDLGAVYGSTWLTSGAGSVLLLWGEAGDIEVELVHLKQPIALVGPLRVHHDHANGHSYVVHDSDPLAILAASDGRGMSPRELAEAMGRGTDKAEIERSRRDLSRLVQQGLADSKKETRANQSTTVYRVTDHGRMVATKNAGMVL
ncbi:bifunctional DNA primase/polymerase [Kocuria sp. CPCC 204721]|uniref:bifunctional DNA primase/polymerase n=1 Tax=Kocuria sp. CPCC 204721 TaxID=3073548 RepID=UPI0034D6AB4A